MIAGIKLPSLYVRAMTQADLPAVLAIDRASFSLPWPESAYLYEVNSNESSVCQVIVSDEPGQVSKIIGMVVTWVILDEAHIATIATHPDYRQKGVARLLLSENLVAVMARGARRAMLEVRNGNLAAQALYRQFGFEIAGRRPHYYKDNGEDALLMTLPLLDKRYLDWLHSHVLVPSPCHAKERHSSAADSISANRSGGEA